MITEWADLTIPEADFDIAALHSALDAFRIERGMTWKAVAEEVNRAGDRPQVRPISATTISSLKSKRWGVEGDGVLQMLLWLDRTPESFVPGHPGWNHADAGLPRVTGGMILRFDVPKIYARLDAQRISRNLTWREAASEVGGISSAKTLQSMRQQTRTAFPQVMRLARWLHCPAAALTRITVY